MQGKHKLELTLDGLDVEIIHIEAVMEKWLNSKEIRAMVGSVEAMRQMNQLLEQRIKVRDLYMKEVLSMLEPIAFEEA